MTPLEQVRNAYTFAVRQAEGNEALLMDCIIKNMEAALIQGLRDQRHACAESVNAAAEDIGGYLRPEAVSHFHAAVMNTPIPDLKPLR